MDDDCSWIEQALGRQPVADAASSSSGSTALRIAQRASLSAMERHEDAVTTASSQAASAGPTRLPQPKASRVTVKKKQLSLAVRGTNLVAGIVPRGCANSRVDAESTRRLDVFKRQLEALDPAALLGLPADFSHHHIRALIAAKGETVNPAIRDKSIENSANNYIFHLTCSRPPFGRQGRANIDEVVAHLDRILQLPAEDRARIGCLLDITRSLLTTRNLGSSYETVRRAVLKREAFIGLPTYR